MHFTQQLVKPILIQNVYAARNYKRKATRKQRHNVNAESILRAKPRLKRSTCSNRYLTARFSVESTEQTSIFVVEQSIFGTNHPRITSQITFCRYISSSICRMLCIQAAFEQQASPEYYN